MNILNPQLLAHIENHQDINDNDNNSNSINQAQQNNEDTLFDESLEFNPNLLDPAPSSPSPLESKRERDNEDDQSKKTIAANPTAISSEVEEESLLHCFFRVIRQKSCQKTTTATFDSMIPIAFTGLVGYVAGSTSPSSSSTVVFGLVFVLMGFGYYNIEVTKTVYQNEKKSSLGSKQQPNIGTRLDESSSTHADRKIRNCNKLPCVPSSLSSNLRQCRLRASAALGSIHALPLMPTAAIHIDPSDDHNDDHDHFLSTNQYSNSTAKDLVSNEAKEKINQEEEREGEIIVEFTETHAYLLSIMDNAIETIKMGGGLYLGLGPNSQSVARVENAVEGRRQISNRCRKSRGSSRKIPEKMKDSAAVLSPLGLRYARELLYGIMCNQASSLDSLLHQINFVQQQEQDSKQNYGWKEEKNHMQSKTSNEDELVEREKLTDDDNDDDDDDEETTADGAQPHLMDNAGGSASISRFESCLAPQFITLSSLISARRELGELLSHVTSDAFSMLLSPATTTTKSLSQEDNKRLKNGSFKEHRTITMLYQNMQQSINATEESAEFLISSFPMRYSKPSLQKLDTALSKNDQNESQQQREDSWSVSVNKTIHSIRTHIDAAYLSLWAFEQQVVLNNPKNSTFFIDTEVSENTNDGDDDDAMHHQKQQHQHLTSTLQSLKYKATKNLTSKKEMDWWCILRDMLQEAIATHVDMNDYIMNDQSSSSVGNIDDEDKGKSQAIDSLQNINRFGKSKYEFSAAGDDDNSRAKTEDYEKELEWKNKTLVFSGKGTLYKNTKTARGSSSSSSLKNRNPTQQPVPPSPFQHPTNLMSLLRELQNRIEKMELAEEWDATVQDDDEGDLTTDVVDSNSISPILETLTETNIQQQNDRKVPSQQHLPSEMSNGSLLQAEASTSNTSSSGLSPPFFLGATGDLLFELKGAMSGTTEHATKESIIGS